MNSHLILIALVRVLLNQNEIEKRTITTTGRPECHQSQVNVAHKPIIYFSTFDEPSITMNPSSDGEKGSLFDPESCQQQSTCRVHVFRVHLV